MNNLGEFEGENNDFVTVRQQVYVCVFVYCMCFMSHGMSITNVSALLLAIHNSF